MIIAGGATNHFEAHQWSLCHTIWNSILPSIINLKRGRKRTEALVHCQNGRRKVTVTTQYHLTVTMITTVNHAPGH